MEKHVALEVENYVLLVTLDLVEDIAFQHQIIKSCDIIYDAFILVGSLLFYQFVIHAVDLYNRINIINAYSYAYHYLSGNLSLTKSNKPITYCRSWCWTQGWHEWHTVPIMLHYCCGKMWLPGASEASLTTLLWRHNERHDVANHRRLHFCSTVVEAHIKENIKASSTFCEGNPRGKCFHLMT